MPRSKHDYKRSRRKHEVVTLSGHALIWHLLRLQLVIRSTKYTKIHEQSLVLLSVIEWIVLLVLEFGDYTCSLGL